jgi:hypothetical protein
MRRVTFSFIPIGVRVVSDAAINEFLSPRRKIERARVHISSLEREIASYLSALKVKREIEIIGPQHKSLWDRWRRIYAHHCEQAKRARALIPADIAYILKLHIETPPPEGIDVIASDAIQNIRQSLDHAACACARAVGKTDKDTYFPIIGPGADLEEAIKDKARKLPPSIKDIIRNAAPGGGLLHELHSLGSVDKHRLMCGVGSAGRAALMSVKASAKGWVSSGFGPDEWDAANQDIRYALASSPLEIDHQFRFTVDVRFDASDIISAQPIQTVLSDLATTAQSIIREMEVEMVRILS